MTDEPSVKQLVPESTLYPEGIRRVIKRQPPILYTLGNSDLLSTPAIGFCGSRKASEQGLETAADCAEQAVNNGITVISGNAAGVDLIAHKTALERNGRTILVIPEGIEHFRIRRPFRKSWDWDRVLVVSQFAPDAVWRADRAMKRNGVIIGLSNLMIVIEAGETGGTINAGLQTLSTGNHLFVANYQDAAPSALGNEKLIALGGQPLRRSKKSGRASFSRILETIDQYQAPEHVPTEHQLQMTLN